MESHSNSSQQSNSVSANVGRDLLVEGDIVGGNKYVANNININVTEGGLKTEITGEFQKLREEHSKSAQTVEGKVSKTGKRYRRELLYKLNLKATRQQMYEALSRWRFVQASPHPPEIAQPVAAVANEILGIGQNTATTFHSPPIPEIANCRVVCELRIIDDGGDPSRWAGFRVRGFRDDIQFGYLVYLRRQGTVELYRAQEVIGGENDFKIKDTKDAWTKIQLDVVNSKISVRVNSKPHIETNDTRFSDKGMVYLHTFGTHAQFRNFSIYRLVR